MLAEMIDKLRELSDAAAAPKIQKVEAEPPYVYFLNGERRQAQVHPRNHIASSLDMIVRFASRDGNEIHGNLSCFYDRKAVVFFFDDSERRDKITMPLFVSKQLKTITGWAEKATTLKQKSLILVMRTMFKDCFSPDNFIDTLRTLKWRSLAESEAEAGKTKVSVGRRIEAEVSGKLEIPDEITLTVPIFESPFSGITGRIQVAIEPQVDDESFLLIPIPGSIDAAIADAEDKIGDSLRASLPEDRVYYGSP